MTSLTDLGSTLPVWQATLLLGPALATGAAAWFAGPGTTIGAAWCAARRATGAALALAMLSLAAMLAGFSGVGHGVRADAVGGLVMLLVSFVAWVIVRYSQPYLNGEPDERHYVRWLMATLSTVSIVVATNNVLVMALAWSATSLALHRLLTFFGTRPSAVVAAHKKFIVGRAADGCMLCAAGLLFAAFGSLEIDQIAQQATAATSLPLSARAAVLLIACAALLKCAQLPFHGWLIQVMEAPTPVSALLHAGIVNMGGFVLLRFAPLLAEVPAAQVLLVLVGTATAVLAALVMTTRISIKVMLAWSTCAQMGFMMMQCGLGVWEMALLHLVAHSLYKAHAFLGAGGAVRRALLVQLTPPAAAPGPLALAAGALIGVCMTLVAGAACGALGLAPAAPTAIWVLAGIVALALVPLVHAQALRLGGLWLPALGLGAFGVVLAYFSLHAWFAALVPPSVTTPTVLQPGLLVGVALAFGALFGLQCLITVSPQGRLAQRLYPWFFGGLFLDEMFHRMAFGMWPPRLPAASSAASQTSETRTAIGSPHATASVQP